MREVDVSVIEERIREACGQIAVHADEEIVAALQKGAAAEDSPRAKAAIGMLLENARAAAENNMPLCQDTGMAVVWIHVGQEVHLTGGSLQEAVQRGISRGYREHYLRASVVADPLFDRRNTGDNTPGVIYCSIEPGDQVKMELMAKGFGSENMSRIAMLKPADGLEGVRSFVLETVRLAGPNACPPMIVGVGVGGTFDYAAGLAKRALLRPLSEENPDSRYAELERNLEASIQELNIGPLGLHGKTGALRVLIETYPTHIAGLPCAVNICCHACRHARMVI